MHTVTKKHFCSMVNIVNTCPFSMNISTGLIGQNMPSVFHSVDYASFSSHFKKLMRSLMLATRCKAVRNMQARVRCPVKFAFGSVNLLAVHFHTTWFQRVKDLFTINTSPHLSNFAAGACQITVEKLLWKKVWRNPLRIRFRPLS